MSTIKSLEAILDEATMYESLTQGSVVCLQLRIVDGAPAVTTENVYEILQSSLRIKYATDTVQALMLLPPGNKYADDYAAVMTQFGKFQHKLAEFYGAVVAIKTGKADSTDSAISAQYQVGLSLCQEVVEIIKKVLDLQYRASLGWE